jgi:hypothetical protein
MFSMADKCHMICNDRCLKEYGVPTCTAWIGIPGFDKVLSPDYQYNQILFSDAPFFTPFEVPSNTSSLNLINTSSPTVSEPPTTQVASNVQQPTVTLTTLWAGNSQGDSIHWDPKAIATCGQSEEGTYLCGISYLPGTKVTLTAVPNEGSVFIGWSGACSGTGTCVVILDTNKTVTATFQINPTPTISDEGYSIACARRYPGSVYNDMTKMCEYPSVQTITPSYSSSSGGKNGLTLIPIDGECCPNEDCDAQVADASGGSPPYHFSSGSFANGAPPMGMIINLNGHLTGKAPAVGTYTFSVCVADMSGASDCKQTRLIVS